MDDFEKSDSAPKSASVQNDAGVGWLGDSSGDSQKNPKTTPLSVVIVITLLPLLVGVAIYFTVVESSRIALQEELMRVESLLVDKTTLDEERATEEFQTIEQIFNQHVETANHLTADIDQKKIELAPLVENIEVLQADNNAMTKELSLRRRISLPQ